MRRDGNRVGAAGNRLAQAMMPAPLTPPQTALVMAYRQAQRVVDENEQRLQAAGDDQAKVLVLLTRSGLSVKRACEVLRLGPPGHTRVKLMLDRGAALLDAAPPDVVRPRRQGQVAATTETGPEGRETRGRDGDE